MSWSPLFQLHFQGFSAGLMFGAGQFLVVGGCPVHCTECSHIPDLHHLGWASTHQMSVTDMQPKTSPDLTDWPLRLSNIWIYCLGGAATMYLFSKASLLLCIFLWSYRTSSVRESCEHSEWIQRLPSPGADPVRALLWLSGRPFFFQDLHSAAFLWITTDRSWTPQQKYLKPSGSCRLLLSKCLSRES